MLQWVRIHKHSLECRLNIYAVYMYLNTCAHSYKTYINDFYITTQLADTHTHSHNAHSKPYIRQIVCWELNESTHAFNTYQCTKNINELYTNL